MAELLLKRFSTKDFKKRKQEALSDDELVVEFSSCMLCVFSSKEDTGEEEVKVMTTLW